LIKFLARGGVEPPTFRFSGGTHIARPRVADPRRSGDRRSWSSILAWIWRGQPQSLVHGPW